MSKVRHTKTAACFKSLNENSQKHRLEWSPETGKGGQGEGEGTFRVWVRGREGAGWGTLAHVEVCR